MKTTVKKMTVLCGSLLASASMAAGETIDAFITPQMSPKARASVYRDLVGYALKMPPGTTLKVHCGGQVEPIATFDLPDYEFYRTNKAKRIQKLKAGIVGLKSWVTKKPVKKEAALSLKVPEIFAYLRNQRHDSSEKSVILLIGSPVVTSVGEAFSMAEEHYPSDGHLTAAPQVTPYSLSGSKDVLAGAVVRWAYLREPTESNITFSGGLRRWWVMFADYQGASLATYDRSLKNTLSVLTSGQIAPVVQVSPDPEARLSMVKAIEPKRPDEEPKPEVAKMEEPEVATVEIPVERTLLEFLETTEITSDPLSASKAQSLRVGVTWRGIHDLDLYAKPHSEAKELSFRSQSSHAGKHLKDHMVSPGENSYEIIELGPCDLNQVEVSVNVFKARSALGVIPATIRLEVDGKIYAQKIQFRVKEGNSGADRKGNRSSSKYWVIVDVAEIVGLK